VKRWLRDWLADEPDDLSLAYRTRQGEVVGTVAGIRGLMLLVRSLDGSGSRLVSEHQAVDRAKFRRLWRRLGGDKQGLRWEGSRKKFRMKGR